MSDNSILNRADGGKTYKAMEVGASSKIMKEDFGSYPDLILTNGLQGKMAGLQIRSITHGLGNNNPQIYVRGLHGMDNNQAIVIVDGVERPLDDLLPEEIESIELLKDASTKILYGARAANGVLSVKTRRGESNKRTYNVTAEMGVSQMTRTPEYLNSYQYAQLYNEARMNDNLPPFYSKEDLEGYRNSKGANDLLYPNVDFFDEFLKRNTNYQKFSFDMNGGTKRTRYSLIAGYTGGGGFEKGQEGMNLHRLTLRGNLDFEVTDFLTVKADVAGRMEMRKWGQLNSSDLFSALNSHRPNEYPLTMSPEDTGLPADSAGVPLFGGSLLRPMNVYSEMMYGGYSEERYMRSQSNIGIDLDLGMLTKGLKAGAYLSFDNYDFLAISLKKTYPTYDVRTYINSVNEVDTLYTQLKKRVINTKKDRTSTKLEQILGWNANVSYENIWNKHSLQARLGYFYNKITAQGGAQNNINSNYTLRANYNFDNKYVAEGTLALMGSNRFMDGNKYFLSSAVGLGWIISNENFLKDNYNINFLKLKASAGILGFDRSTDYMLYNQAWSTAGSFKFGVVNNGSTAYMTNFKRAANTDLRWEKSKELNLGLEGLFLNNRLYTEMNYFREVRSDIIGNLDSGYSNLVGDFVYQGNMGKVLNKGFEASISWQDKISEFSYRIGANVTMTKNKVLEWNQVMHSDEYRYTTGYSTDNMQGLVALGLFGKDVDLDSHVAQSFGDYKEGDIAYLDVNKDGVVDDRDVKSLGNSYPRTTLGFDVNLNYKGWSLYIQGYSELGVNSWANNSYYWNSGEGKYSVLTIDRYHPENNPGGTYPRLTTTNGINNFRNSSFWLLNTSFFRLKNLEFSYTFNKFNFGNLNSIKIFARGSNLFVLSSVKDLDPELLNSGITNYPVMRNITAGVSFDF